MPNDGESEHRGEDWGVGEREQTLIPGFAGEDGGDSIRVDINNSLRDAQEGPAIKQHQKQMWFNGPRQHIVLLLEQ